MGKADPDLGIFGRGNFSKFPNLNIPTKFRNKKHLTLVFSRQFFQNPSSVGILGLGEKFPLCNLFIPLDPPLHVGRQSIF